MIRWTSPNSAPVRSPTNLAQRPRPHVSGQPCRRRRRQARSRTLIPPLSAVRPTKISPSEYPHEQLDCTNRDHAERIERRQGLATWAPHQTRVNADRFGMQYEPSAIAGQIDAALHDVPDKLLVAAKPEHVRLRVLHLDRLLIVAEARVKSDRSAKIAPQIDGRYDPDSSCWCGRGAAPIRNRAAASFPSRSPTPDARAVCRAAGASGTAAQ